MAGTLPADLSPTGGAAGSDLPGDRAAGATTGRRAWLAYVGGALGLAVVVAASVALAGNDGAPGGSGGVGGVVGVGGLGPAAWLAAVVCTYAGVALARPSRPRKAWGAALAWVVVLAVVLVVLPVRLVERSWQADASELRAAAVALLEAEPVDTCGDVTGQGRTFPKLGELGHRCVKHAHGPVGSPAAEREVRVQGRTDAGDLDRPWSAVSVIYHPDGPARAMSACLLDITDDLTLQVGLAHTAECPAGYRFVPGG